MSDSGQVHRSKPGQEEAEAQVDERSQPSDREVLDDVDELLDEIDEVLEENAEEFVRGYVQKGGE